jgi:hypothetical protein
VVSCTGELPQELHQVAMEPFTKFDPVMVMVIGLLVPAMATDGEMDVTTGPVIVKVRLFEVTPLAESVTLTAAFPEFASSAAVTVAVMEVAVLEVTASTVLLAPTFQLTTGEGVGKLVPLKFRLKPVWPAMAEFTLRLDNDAPGPTVNVCVLTGWEPGELMTPICEVAEDVSRLIGITAVSCVPPT